RHADHPEAARARLALGHALLADGRTGEAARVFNDVWIQTPAAPEAESAARQLQVLGESGLAGRPPGSRERLERAERLLAAGLADRAASEADGLVSDALPVDLKARALKVVFETARRAGRQDAAAATITRALSVLPPERRPPWLLDLASLQKRRNPVSAMAALDRLVREYPKSAEAADALLLKGRMLEESLKFPDAEAVYEKLAAGYPDQEEAGTALWRLGWLAWFRGAHAEAERWWTRLLSLRAGQAH